MKDRKENLILLIRKRGKMENRKIKQKKGGQKILMVVYDNDAYTTFFLLGLGYLASAARNAGHDITIYQQDIFHWPEEHLIDYLDKNEFDVVMVSVIGVYYQYRKLLKLSDAINSSKNRHHFKYLIGGHGPAA